MKSLLQLEALRTHQIERDKTLSTAIHKKSPAKAYLQSITALDARASDSLLPQAPRALLIATEKWHATALFAHSMTKAGYAVAALCPFLHPLRSLSKLTFATTYIPLIRFSQLDRLISNWHPDLVIPCDDKAVAQLHELYRRYRGQGSKASQHKADLIKNSIGGVEHPNAVRHKSALIEMAKNLGIDVPETQVIQNESELHEWIAAHPNQPIVLKRDGTWGGQGVSITLHHHKTIQVFRQLLTLQPWRNVLRSALQRGDLEPLSGRLSATLPVIAAQEFIRGRDLNRAVICSNGNVLAGITVEVLHAMPANGPATVVRTLNHNGIDGVVCRLVAHLKLSGFVGFDFLLDQNSGRALLIEMNFRPTPASYLVDYGRHSLAAQMFASHMNHTTHVAAELAPPGRQFVLFPQEWQRDGHSPYLSSPDHFVPWDEPEIVKRCIDDVRQCHRIRSNSQMATALHF